MDLTNVTLVGLMALGIVNVLGFFKPDLDSRVKFTASLAAAFAVTFIPAEMGVILLDKVKLALEAAFAASGLYKIATKAGGK